MEQDMKDLLETVIAIKDTVEKLPTREEFAALPTREEISVMIDVKLDEKLLPIMQELRSIRKDIDDLKTEFENLRGVTKEIDHLLERVVAIEKHLGIQPVTTTA